MSANNFRKHLDLNLRQLILLLAIFSVSSLFIISLIRSLAKVIIASLSGLRVQQLS